MATTANRPQANAVGCLPTGNLMHIMMQLRPVYGKRITFSPQATRRLKRLLVLQREQAPPPGAPRGPEDVAYRLRQVASRGPLRMELVTRRTRACI